MYPKPRNYSGLEDHLKKSKTGLKSEEIEIYETTGKMIRCVSEQMLVRKFSYLLLIVLMIR